MSYNLEHHDGFVGYILAFEGVSDAMTMIHGPTGCKFHPSDFSERVYSERNGKICSRNALVHSSKFFFGQPRVPCTAMDGNAVVIGASDRSVELYRSLVGMRPSLIGVVNSPGASLIGENTDGLKSKIPTVVVESCGFSSPLHSCFDECSKRIMEEVIDEVPKHRSGVNIIGLSLFHGRALDNADEIRRILSLCGIEVNCFLCAGSSVDDIRKMPSAELNVVVDPDFGTGAAEYCFNKFGTPFITSVPIGFDATERFIKGVCERLGRDPSPALADVLGWRRRAADKLRIAEKRFIRMRGRTFSVKATSSLCISLADFIHGYLGLVPVALDAGGVPVHDILSISVTDDFWNTPVDVAFCSGNESTSMIDRRFAKGAVDICEPFRRTFSIRPMPIFGTMGAVTLIEDVVNILGRTGYD